ncbi:Bug family tripartite tricarboxylate transporter substrate binding protein [Bosea sp. LjRoot237]|uniref:Bug family tripartite tricarboxylate transporter substrate binding protein n=1 Tax=Bosea sp. LjRoot237 TaxID=3342292 RepID=UPI003ECC28B1
MPRLLATATLVALLASAAGTLPGRAQDGFPARPVRIVMPLPTGSALDVVARLVGEQLSSRWGQQVVVENRPGASGLLAAQAVAAAAPDGYTLLGGAAFIFTILPAQTDKPPIDLTRSFVPIAWMGGGPMYIAVPPRLGVNSLPELIALARSKPREIMVGTNGTGTLPHFAALALERKGDVPITVVPYATGGTLEAIRDILGGRVHATIETMSGLRGAVQAGDLKLIAVMSSERNPQFPDVPTVAETLPGLTAVGWMILSAPAGTPEPIVLRLNEAVRHALATPLVRQRFDEIGVEAKAMSPAESRAFIESEQRLWWPIVKDAAPK